MQLISIIIPTYKNVRLFEQAVKSIIRQTVCPCEIIVSDDSPSDDIRQYCVKLDNPIIKYFSHESTGNAVDNWNFGLSRATGDWIILLHHDEALGNDRYIETLLANSDRHDLLVSDIRVISNGIIRRGRVNGFIKKMLLKSPSSIFGVNFIGPCACVALKKTLLDRFDSNLTWLVDVDWYYRLLKKSRNTLYDPNLIINSNHGHSDQITKNIDIAQKSNEDNLYLKEKYKGCDSINVALYLGKFIGLFRNIKRKI